MTDFFALLGQPRHPWLDADELKQAFHARSRESHPDAQPNESSGAVFTQLNEAYQTLQDPKRRLQHLLALEGFAPQPGAAPIPPEIEVLFPRVAALTHDAQQLLQKTAAATNPLMRSLLKSQLLEVQQRLTETLGELDQLHRDGIATLQRLSHSWSAADAAAVAELQRLYLRFSYVTRWSAELREQQLQLSTA
jgi:curved DNA-binding protein CbpA